MGNVINVIISIIKLISNLSNGISYEFRIYYYATTKLS